MMRVLVTGSAGHLGEALVHTFRDSGHEVVGLDVLDSPASQPDGGHRLVRSEWQTSSQRPQRLGWSLLTSCARRSDRRAQEE
jgi:nucleoside-diphosphate-sugar epimerase